MKYRIFPCETSYVQVDYYSSCVVRTVVHMSRKQRIFEQLTIRLLNHALDPARF